MLSQQTSRFFFGCLRITEFFYEVSTRRTHSSACCRHQFCPIVLSKRGFHKVHKDKRSTMKSFCLALIVASDFLKKATAECLSDPALDAIFAGDSTIPREDSCCQNDVCNIPCPVPVPSPPNGMYRLMLLYYSCCAIKVVQSAHGSCFAISQSQATGSLSVSSWEYLSCWVPRLTCESRVMQRTTL